MSLRGLAGKKVVITGAAGGIGLATTERFLDEGSSVLAVDVRPLDDTRLVMLGAVPVGVEGRLAYLQADLAQPAGMAVFEAALDKVGVDVVVNNAGITRDASLGKMTLEQWDAVIATNLTAVFRVAQSCGVRMKANKRGGVILNAASVVAHNGNFGQSNYVAAKAGVIGLTKTLARELGRAGVRVNAVAPGFIETAMTKAVPGEVLAGMAERTPLGRLGKPEEIAAVYAFLASDDASYISGACINVDGGLVV